ncbi:MAG TPA: trypsin-like peptidase domain-containing protein [Candidatus Paceibacterota bacterium]|nr:trypsin-like peptidase domain-containing protein [Candidatus Paceibacterota bacterium]
MEFQSPDYPQNATIQRPLWGVVFVSAVVGFLAGGAAGGYAYWQVTQQLEEAGIAVSSTDSNGSAVQVDQELKVIDVVKEVSPAVVSVILTQDVPVYERVLRDPFEDLFGGPSPFSIPELQQRGTERREIGGGSGFLVSADGMVATNRHVVSQDNVEYTVFLRDGTSYDATVLATDPLQDLAFLKIERAEPFPFVKLGDSDALEIGQSVVAIGNALGEFQNTVSVGVISGLGRTITASDGGSLVETIEDVIQTDAAINKGNSGGPLLNLSGEVVGVNTATVLQAQSIGFAIPIEGVQRDLYQMANGGEIEYPFLGVRYVPVTKQLQEEESLPVDYGVFVTSGSSQPAVTPDSAAQKAGLKEGDVIVEIDGQRVMQENSLGKILRQYAKDRQPPIYRPGDTIALKVFRDGAEITLSATLGERPE